MAPSCGWCSVGRTASFAVQEPFIAQINRGSGYEEWFMLNFLMVLVCLKVGVGDIILF